MGFDMYMFVGDKPAPEDKPVSPGDKEVVGESLDKAHYFWVECTGFEANVAQKTTGQGAHSGGKADFAPFVVKKQVDLASPTLAQFCAAAKSIKCVTIHVCRSTGGGIGDKLRKPFLVYQLFDAIVCDVSTAGEGGGDNVIPTESVSFAYGVIHWKYFATGGFLTAQGVKKKKDLKGWNVRQNVADAPKA